MFVSWYRIQMPVSSITIFLIVLEIVIELVIKLTIRERSVVSIFL